MSAVLLIWKIKSSAVFRIMIKEKQVLEEAGYEPLNEYNTAAEGTVALLS